MIDDPAAAETPEGDPSAAGTPPNETADSPAARERPVSGPQQAPAPTIFDLDVAKLTDVGRARPHNEDYVDFRIPPDSRELARKGSLFLVADGMGGHQAGEVASRGAVETAIEHYYSDTGRDVPTSLVRAIRAANQRIYEQSHADPTKAGMGTTLVAAAIVGRRVYVANVGDSRAYLINRQGIVQITEDHSWVEEQVRAGLLTEEQARKHPQRNLVTRALGSKPSVEVDLFEGEISTGDKLLLCSDGLTGRVPDAEIAAMALQHPAAEAARRLVAEANERGGNDNITVLIVAAQAESATVKAPVIPAPGRKAGRRLPLVPVLAALSVLILVAIAGFWAWNAGIIGGADETPTPSPQAMTASPLPSATEGAVPFATETASPTVEPTSTLADMPTETAEAPTPTQTPIPTDTSTATATETSTATATQTSTATQEAPTPGGTTTPGLPTAPLTLEQPEVDVRLSGVVTFTWTAHRPLGPAEAFQFVIWQADEATLPPPSFLHESPLLSEESYEYNLDNFLSQDDVGQPFLWSVRLVSTDDGDPLTDTAPPRRFLYGPDEEP